MSSPPAPHLSEPELARLMLFALDHAVSSDIQLAIRCVRWAGASLDAVLRAALQHARMNRSYLRAAFEWGARFGLAEALRGLSGDPREPVRYAVEHALVEFEAVQKARREGRVPADVAAFEQRLAQPELDEREHRALRLIFSPGDADRRDLARLLFERPERLEMFGRAAEAAAAALDLDTLLQAAHDARPAPPSSDFVSRLTAFDDPRAERLLIALAGRHNDGTVEYALARIGTPACLAALIDLLESRPHLARRALGSARREQVGEPLLNAYRERGFMRRREAATVAELCGEAAIPALTDALRDDLRAVREPAGRALASLGAPAAAALLEVAHNAPEPSRRQALRALVTIDARLALPLLLPIVEDPAAPLRCEAIAELGRALGPQAEPTLLALLQDGDVRVRAASLDTLCAVFESDTALAALRTIARTDAEQRRRIVALLGRRAGEPAPAAAADPSLRLLFLLYVDPGLPDVQEPIAAALIGGWVDSVCMHTTLDQLVRAATASGQPLAAPQRAALDALIEKVEGARRDELERLRRLQMPDTPPGQQQQQQQQAERARPGLLRDLLGWAFDLKAPPPEQATKVRGPFRHPGAAGTAAHTAPLLEHCYFSATAPAQVAPLAPFIVQLWCHAEEPGSFLRPSVLGSDAARSTGPVAIERGATMDVELRLPHFEIDVDRASMCWIGQVGVVGFGVRSTPATPLGDHLGSARVAINGLPVASVALRICVGATNEPAIDCSANVHMLRSAFASYASEDRDDVLARVQGMQKVLPSLQVFVDVLKLRSGEDWQQRLVEEIGRTEKLFLFWSRSARASRWVDFEWRTALHSRGEAFIDPVPLEPPDRAPPPPELAKRHFNDWTLYFRRR